MRQEHRTVPLDELMEHGNGTRRIMIAEAIRRPALGSEVQVHLLELDSVSVLPKELTME
jgi:hypothetical protein